MRLTETGSGTAVSRVWGRGRNGKLVFNGFRVSIWEDAKFWRYMVGIVA